MSRAKNFWILVRSKSLFLHFIPNYPLGRFSSKEKFLYKIYQTMHRKILQRLEHEGILVVGSHFISRIISEQPDIWRCSSRSRNLPARNTAYPPNLNWNCNKTLHKDKKGKHAEKESTFYGQQETRTPAVSMPPIAVWTTGSGQGNNCPCWRWRQR